MQRYELRVNGEDRSFEVEPSTPLLWVIREELGLKGTRYGCGQGLCGSCTVHLDGEPVRSCVTPMDVVRDRSLTTIEGLSTEGDHPLQRAWLAERVPQCGYCQSGQIMSAAALLDSRPRPTDDEIDAAMSGNLCRCGTYGRIRRAIRRAAQEAPENE